jgi:hypothetical protein
MLRFGYPYRTRLVIVYASVSIEQAKLGERILLLVVLHSHELLLDFLHVLHALACLFLDIVRKVLTASKVDDPEGRCVERSGRRRTMKGSWLHEKVADSERALEHILLVHPKK